MQAVAEVNWDGFGEKFNKDKQGAFERLCYLLFCKEHGKNTGIFRFKNHAGIETDPVGYNGKVIGWQAKFYATRLSEHENDFISSIETAKTRHPTINKIIFYTNQEFGQDPQGTDPAYKIKIENHAKAQDVEIEWRTASYFESPFVCEENFVITQHFFSLRKGVLDSIQALSTHTESVLKLVHSEIVWRDEKIKLDRSIVAEDLQRTLRSSPLVILSGGAGVGKTAVVKDFHKAQKSVAPCFLFKATQFNKYSSVDELLGIFGELTLSDFIKEHEDIETKYFVIDSAEKLSDIENREVFQIFLSTLLKSGWKMVFTVRYPYLDDLKFQLKEIYYTTFQSLNIPDLAAEELEKLSVAHRFHLPQNERLCGLLQIPLYLNEYLQNYEEITSNITYAEFRGLIWRKHIQCSAYQKNNLHMRREECFLSVAQERANSGNFFVKAPGCDQEALSRLALDEIVQWDANAGGYFITHDVYEEWALEKIIERSFRRAQDYEGFYQEIGSSLPVRRAFRSWLSDKLLLNDEAAKKCIECTVSNAQIDRHWKDEVLVSVLLSDYSAVFFDHFAEELLRAPETRGSFSVPSNAVQTDRVSYKSEDRLLYRILFLLRIACKTIDEDFLYHLGLTKTEGTALKTIFTIPKGKGWDCVIAFVNKHKTELQFRYLNALLPVLDDWNRKNKEGETTRNASQVALFYYEELTKQDGFYFSSDDDIKDKLIRTILNGSHEIKTELTRIVDEVVARNDASHRGRYYELARVALSSLIQSAEIAKNLPQEVMRLANLFWFYTPPKASRYSEYRNDIEQYFDLAGSHFEYYPASALQTPVLQLLQTSPQEAVDFILSVTNRSIEYFAQSEFARHEVETVEVCIEGSQTPIQQYICHRIWNIYRGTQVAPSLLESMHMALERWLLMVVAKVAAPQTLEAWCLYLIKNSRSASITAVVASVVLAEPSKLFNVACVLFRTKEFFFYDMARRQLDMTARSTYAISHDPEGIFKNERLQTCDDKHRSHTLEDQALSYQLFVSKEEGEEVAKKRQEMLWKIFDEYYAQIPDTSQETEHDKVWRLCLARMDRRKMTITTETKDDQLLVRFNPNLDPELKKYSEDSLAKSSESTQYVSLKLWSYYRFGRNEEEYKKYPQYDDDIQLVISDTKKIIEGLQSDETEDKSFTLFYHSVPPYTCAVLIRDHFDVLASQEKEFCKKIILEYASLPLHGDYQYQISDGVNAAINTLPLLLKPFAQDAKVIKETLLFTLFDAHPIGVHQCLADYSVSAIVQNLWKERPEDANALLLGYLLLKPKFDDLSETIRRENYKKNLYRLSYHSVLRRFRAEHESDLSHIVSNQLTYNDLANLDNIDSDTLVRTFLLLPLRTTDCNHKRFASELFPILARRMFHQNDGDERVDYTLKHRFLEKFAYFVLTSAKEDIEVYLQPFLNGFGSFRDVDSIFSEFILAEDKLNQYDEFWFVWNQFYPKIRELCKSTDHRLHSANIVYNYLLAWPYWKEDAKEWHSLKEREKKFIKKVAEEIGDHPAVLYALSKLLNEIGSDFLNDGIFWISDIFRKNPTLSTEKLEVNTIYYLENLARRYILGNHHKIRTILQIKNQILVMLNFLLEKGSVAAYLLREDIL